MADDLETWYAAGARVLPYFMSRSKLVPYAFVLEKGKTIDFSELIVIYDLKLATDDRREKNVSVDIKTVSPGGCLPPALGLYPCIKT